MTSPLRAELPKLRLAEPRIRQVLIPFDKGECINLKQAADIAGKSESTMRSWAEEHSLGRCVGGGTWSISCTALAISLMATRGLLGRIMQATAAASS